MNNSEPCRPSSQDWHRLASLYDLEAYLFKTVATRFDQTRTSTPFDFFAIVTWKSNRTKTKIVKGLAEAGKTVESLMRNVHDAASHEARVETLLQVFGIGLPMASAILTVCYPDELTVLDYRAWKILRKQNVPDLPRREPRTITEYLQYCTVCRSFAAEVGLSLRNLDRALWAASWEQDLYDLIRTMPNCTQHDYDNGDL